MHVSWSISYLSDAAVRKRTPLQDLKTQRPIRRSMLFRRMAASDLQNKARFRAELAQLKRLVEASH
jgi:hypothetical protein